MRPGVALRLSRIAVTDRGVDGLMVGERLLRAGGDGSGEHGEPDLNLDVIEQPRDLRIAAAMPDEAVEAHVELGVGGEITGRHGVLMLVQHVGEPSGQLRVVAAGCEADGQSLQDLAYLD